MKVQKQEYSCGAAAVVNALRALGVKVRERDVLARMDFDPKRGTDDEDVSKALAHFGFQSRICSISSKTRSAWEWLFGALSFGSPVICTVDKGRHYVVAIGVLGTDRIVFFDSLRARRVTKECGTFVFSKAEWMKFWASKDGDKYEAVRVLVR